MSRNTNLWLAVSYGIGDLIPRAAEPLTGLTLRVNGLAECQSDAQSGGPYLNPGPLTMDRKTNGFYTANARSCLWTQSRAIFICLPSWYIFVLPCLFRLMCAHLRNISRPEFCIHLFYTIRDTCLAHRKRIDYNTRWLFGSSSLFTATLFIYFAPLGTNVLSRPFCFQTLIVICFHVSKRDNVL